MTTSRTDDRAAGLSGALVSLADLIDLRGPARALEWGARTRVRSARPGQRASRFRGRGIDFSETRVYEPGDDVRHIDWRVTARTGVAHTKIFQEERERPVLVVADLGRSAFFGTRRRTKSVAISEIAGLLVWAAYDGGDRIGAIVASPGAQHAYRPRHSRATVLRIQQRIADDATALANRYRADGAGVAAAPEAEVDGAQGLIEALTQARRVARPGTTVVVISDFMDARSLDERGAVRRQLYLLARHCEVDAVLVSDPFERELPEGDRYALSDGRARVLLDTSPTRTRARWREAFEGRAAALEQIVGGRGGRLLSIATDDAIGEQLGRWLR